MVPADLGELLFFDRSGAPVDLNRYAELHADLGYRIVARSRVGGDQPLEVVTAWLGVDQGFGDGPAPLIFGTAALDVDGQLWRDQEWLAASEDEALINHQKWTALLS